MSKMPSNKENISVYIDADIAQMIRDYAKEKEMSVSSFIQEVITSFFTKEELILDCTYEKDIYDNTKEILEEIKEIKSLVVNLN